MNSKTILRLDEVMVKVTVRVLVVVKENIVDDEDEEGTRKRLLVLDFPATHRPVGESHANSLDDS